jgi:hypothetical protein
MLQQLRLTEPSTAVTLLLGHQQNHFYPLSTMINSQLLFGNLFTLQWQLFTLCVLLLLTQCQMMFHFSMSILR